MDDTSTPTVHGADLQAATAHEAPATLSEGARLVRASKAYAEEDRATTWRLLATTLLAWLLAEAVAFADLPLPIRLLGTGISGLLIVRMFIFFHDWQHGAIFRKSPLGQAVLGLYGLYILCPWSVWRETHDYHHQNNAKLIGTSIGSYPVVSTRMWRHMTSRQRRAYAFARHPATIALGYFTVFAMGMCVGAFLRNPKKHWGGPLALAFHGSVLAALGLTGGWDAALLAGMLPCVVATGLGSYLFYAQHNYPTAEYVDRREWSYHHAALHTSSMFEMNPVLHWFTGNIGYHHVHHLNHRIPFYRLPEAMADMPELQGAGVTSWRVADVAACLSLKLWDTEKGRLVTWREAAARS